MARRELHRASNRSRTPTAALRITSPSSSLSCSRRLRLRLCRKMTKTKILVSLLLVPQDYLFFFRGMPAKAVTFTVESH